MSLLSFAQTTIVLGISWISWTLLRRAWSRSPLDNIPGPKAPSFLIGHLAQLADPLLGYQLHHDISQKYGRVVKMRGLLGGRLLYVFDPKALHSITLKDQDKYEETEHFVEANKIMLGPGLLSTTGQAHKRQRKMLAPAFSGTTMRDMAPIFYAVCHKLRSAIKRRVTDGPTEIDMSGWMTRTSLEVIGQIALGHSFDTLLDDQVTNTYAQSLKDFLPTITSLLPLQPLVPYISKIGSPNFRRRVLDLMAYKPLHRLRDIIETLEQTSKRIIDDKKRAIASGDEDATIRVGEGKDIMSVLIRENMKESNVDRLSDEELISEVSVVTFVGTDTTSSALSRALHLLSLHPAVQDKLRAELVAARSQTGGEDIPFEELEKLPYLDAVCRETLRLHAPAPFVPRRTLEDTILPLSQAIVGLDGSLMNDIHIPKNTILFVGITASNTDTSVWGDQALEWNPERWLAPLPPAVKAIPGIYSNMMSFLSGARSCIGMKLSQTEMKIVLALLVETFCFSPPKQEIVWNFSAVIFPSVKGDTGPARMPLTVTLA